MSWFNKKSNASIDNGHKISLTPIYELLKCLFTSTTTINDFQQLMVPNVETKFVNMISNAEFSNNTFESFWSMFKSIYRSTADYTNNFKLIKQIISQTNDNEFSIQSITEEELYDPNSQLWNLYEVHRNYIINVGKTLPNHYYKIKSYQEIITDKKFIQIMHNHYKSGRKYITTSSI
jgi:hypothetical protein